MMHFKSATPKPEKVVIPVSPSDTVINSFYLELILSTYRINKILEEIMKITTHQTSESYRNRRSPSRHNNLDHVRTLLEKLDPDMWYGDWLRVLMAIFYESEGSEEGFDIANDWSSQGWKYKGEKEIRYKWDSFDLSHPHPITIGTLIRMANGNN